MKDEGYTPGPGGPPSPPPTKKSIKKKDPFLPRRGGK